MNNDNDHLKGMMLRMEEVLVLTYKKSEVYNNLRLYVRKPKLPKSDASCIIFFHGAGFSNNKVTAGQFQHHAAHFSSLGILTIRAEYRPLELEGLFSPIESLKNAKSAIRWVRENSELLGIDRNKVIAAGASAGGYLCLCTAMISGFNDPADNLFTDPAPNAMIVFNGGVNSEALIDLFPNEKEQLIQASPIEVVREGLPPSLFFHGAEDRNIPYEDVKSFNNKMKSKGNFSRLIKFEGLGHGFFNYGNYDNEPYQKTLLDTEEFLREVNFWR